MALADAITAVEARFPDIPKSDDPQRTGTRPSVRVYADFGLETWTTGHTTAIVVELTYPSHASIRRGTQRDNALAAGRTYLDWVREQETVGGMTVYRGSPLGAEIAEDGDGGVTATLTFEVTDGYPYQEG